MESEGIHIRWMIRRDMPEVLAIENDSFEYPWLEEDFIRCLRQRNCIGMVAERSEVIAGYMIYELHSTNIHLLNFAVRKDFRRRGYGRQLIEKLAAKLSPQRRNKLIVETRESNLTSQLFLKSVGFVAKKILKDFYDNGEDAYHMRLKHGEEVQSQLQCSLLDNSSQEDNKEEPSSHSS